MQEPGSGQNPGPGQENWAETVEMMMMMVMRGIMMMMTGVTGHWTDTDHIITGSGHAPGASNGHQPIRSQRWALTTNEKPGLRA